MRCMSDRIVKIHLSVFMPGYTKSNFFNISSIFELKFSTNRHSFYRSCNICNILHKHVLASLKPHVVCVTRDKIFQCKAQIRAPMVADIHLSGQKRSSTKLRNDMKQLKVTSLGSCAVYFISGFTTELRLTGLPRCNIEWTFASNPGAHG